MWRNLPTGCVRMGDEVRGLGTSVRLCRSQALQDSGIAVLFDLLYFSKPCPAFAVRYAGTAHAYLNRCAHVPMEMDMQPGQFFDISGQWLVCATHGAMYAPHTGACLGGPCRGGLVKIALSEADGWVHWHTCDKFQPLAPS